jgi:hypothetical protein
MLNPALARALAVAHIEDLHRAAARRHMIRLAHQRGDSPRRHRAPRIHWAASLIRCPNPVVSRRVGPNPDEPERPKSTARPMKTAS